MDGFEAYLAVPALSDGLNFRAIFIPAPLIESVGPRVEVLARLGDWTIVVARQGHLLVTSFHRELTDDQRLHQLFLAIDGASVL